MTHRNITSTPTRYPAPAHWYGEGKYYVEAEADHADRRATENRAMRPKPEPPPPVIVHRPITYTKTCRNCRNTFTARRSALVFCSKPCAWEYEQKGRVA